MQAIFDSIPENSLPMGAYSTENVSQSAKVEARNRYRNILPNA
jgi:hypothetical protein